jgi:radical SAM protein with 4Fe4S-binding SPASM domain
MACPQPRPMTNLEFLDAFHDRVERDRLPISGSVELTRRCNLRCVHCYAGPSPAARTDDELSAAEWRRLLDEVTRAGCLYLLITGGEPLLHRDFREIYRHAKEIGLLVTLFTNATLVDEALADFLAELPPRSVEVSLYGAGPAIHDAVTGAAGSFQRGLDGIHRLLSRRLPARLKSMLMRLNRDEIPALRTLAAELGVPFRVDALLFPRFDRDHAPMQLRVSPAEAVAAEFGDPEELRRWRDHLLRQARVEPSGTLYQCNAGHTTFHITPAGCLQPCLMADRLTYDLRRGDFMTGWNQVMPRLAGIPVDSDQACRHCQFRQTCGYCPAQFGLETGAEDQPSQYMCQLGRERLTMIQQ